LAGHRRNELGQGAYYHSDGAVELDQYARAKDILALVLPFLATAAGFWLGSQGTVQAQRQAADATAAARKRRSKVRDLVRSTANEGWYLPAH
jgi:hypothetical protein